VPIRLRWSGLCFWPLQAQGSVLARSVRTSGAGVERTIPEGAFRRVSFLKYETVFIGRESESGFISRAEGEASRRSWDTRLLIDCAEKKRTRGAFGICEKSPPSTPGGRTDQRGPAGISIPT
jgi:hypothetical protein